jgi:hypothetical protein
MKRFGHGLLTLILLVVTTCTALRAEPQAHEAPNGKKQSDTCPMHSGHSDHSNDSQPASQTCANCLSSHFVSESKVHFAVALLAVITPFHVVDHEGLIISTAIVEEAATGFLIDTSPLVLRI